MMNEWLFLLMMLLYVVSIFIAVYIGYKLASLHKPVNTDEPQKPSLLDSIRNIITATIEDLKVKKHTDDEDGGKGGFYE